MEEKQKNEGFIDLMIKRIIDLCVFLWSKTWFKIILLIGMMGIKNNRIFLGFIYKYITGEIRVDEGDVTTLLQVVPVIVVSYLGYKINQEMYIESKKRKATDQRIAQVTFSQLAYEYLTKIRRISIFWDYRIKATSQDDFESDDLIEYYQYYLNELDELNDLSKRRQANDIELIKIFGDKELFEILTKFSFNEDVLINIMYRDRDVSKPLLEKSDNIDLYRSTFLEDLKNAKKTIVELEEYDKVIKEASSRVHKLIQ